MFRTKGEILADLNPSDPATIQALIDFHKGSFGGWVMEGEDDSKPDGDKGAKPDDKPGEGEADDKPLGPNGEKALQAERDARKALEGQLSQFKAGLAAALGVDEKDAKSSTDDVLATIQKQMASMQHENLVLSLANTHKITDEDDLKLLRTITDEAALRMLAGRLKPAEGAANGQRKTPAPDPSQGRGTSNGSRPTGVSAGADLFTNRKKTTTTKE